MYNVLFWIMFVDLEEAVTVGRILLMICILLLCEAPEVAAPLLALPELPNSTFMASPNFAG
jgi:hypothetical protein